MSREQRAPTKAQQSRRAARELAVQGLYQWQMTEKSISAVEAEFRSQVPDDDLETHENWLKVMEIADLALFHELLHNVARYRKELDADIAPLLDRRLEDIDPIELAILRLGAYELSRRLEVPYRAVINEGVELAKSFGATDGHKYINSILDKLAIKLRSAEVSARRR
ncbi:transcription antitermination factor NusB [Halomonas denitrificans]|uniref:transcription antitermination factor NusB n=1 Tax=Halomonas TaxID=2745 RepID=UPI001A8F42D8|nr:MULTISPECIES: transcription antitermination factor NusB [Halomonas]MED5294797.1 transcription antitermination factor NusB [Pseudomonadota bacterium]MBN8412196.1 transcription antitermination factor NusB [Halomonas litopenaei]MBY5924472.1 transcription antitermination factor NusB [Halomonas sp. DP4Y7-2]MBY5929817.1 transcription antitermination factor NusB [Halomonas sp. DP8Y7-3]MBY5968433.1 transcription antitermination factor NusB [Halomonas denitrificans]